MDTLTSQFLHPINFQLAWEKVAANNGCAGVDGETIAQFAAHADENLARLLKAVATGEYRPMPLLQFFIPKKQGGWRSLSVPTVRDRIVQQALLQVLHPVMEVHFEACSFAYRPGRSHLMAVREVVRWRESGYDWILDADIVNYFDKVVHQRLHLEVAERINHPLVLSLIQAWLSVGVLTKEGLVLPEKGIAQGSVISPMLANVYLDDFDEVLSGGDLKLVRYADDFLLMGRSHQRIIQAKAEVAELLESIGLQLHPDKTQITNFKRGFRFLGSAFAGDLIVPVKQTTQKTAPLPIQANSLRLIHADPAIQTTTMEQAMVKALKAASQPIPPPLFVVLGYTVRQKEPVKIESDEIEWKTGMSTLYLVHQGTTLRREQGRFLLQPPKEAEVEIPILEVERILVFGNIQLSTAAISACLDAQISVVFLTQLGEYKGHLWSAEFCDLKAEQAQFCLQDDDKFQKTMSQAIVQGKLRNSKNFLLKLNRKRRFPEVESAIAGISQDFLATENATLTMDALRGYEGIAATRYFQAMGRLITNPGFTFTERNRRPPKDPVNSMLSFGYTLLFNNVLSLILAEGLNPYLGNLHRSERKEPRLAFDLMEEFRSPIVDTLVIKLVNQKILNVT